VAGHPLGVGATTGSAGEPEGEVAAGRASGAGSQGTPHRTIRRPSWVRTAAEQAAGGPSELAVG
jgi:hypothetical protein